MEQHKSPAEHVVKSNQKNLYNFEHKFWLHVFAEVYFHRAFVS